MSSLAVISDLHSNVEALTAVFADIDAHGLSDVICLGDVVGYGPEPAPCVDLVMDRCRVCLKGNHDEALIHGAYAFTPPARRAIDWTRDQLKPGWTAGADEWRRWRFLRGLPLRYERGPDLFIHGSPRDPTNEYLLATFLGFGPSERFEETFAGFERLLFVGHTHLPCVITEDYQTFSAAELQNEYRIPPGKKVIVNVGSVGQPRDRDNRSCYVIFDGETIRWRRVRYDHRSTARKIAAISRLEAGLAARLQVGI